MEQKKTAKDWADVADKVVKVAGLVVSAIFIAASNKKQIQNLN